METPQRIKTLLLMIHFWIKIDEEEDKSDF